MTAAQKSPNLIVEVVRFALTGIVGERVVAIVQSNSGHKVAPEGR